MADEDKKNPRGVEFNPDLSASMKQEAESPIAEDETKGDIDPSSETLSEESVDLDVDLDAFSDFADDPLPEPYKPKIKWKDRIFPHGSRREFLKNYITKKYYSSLYSVKEFKAKSSQFFKEDFKLILSKFLKDFFKNLAKKYKKAKKNIKAYSKLSWKIKLLFVFTVVVLITVFQLLNKIFNRELIPKIEQVYVINFDEVADHIFELSEDEEWEAFRSPLRHPEYIVKFEKMFIILKSFTKRDFQPTLILSLYVEANSQDAARELKDRQAEFYDIIARTFEGIKRENLSDTNGKMRAKKVIKKEMNKAMTKGKVVKIYYRDFLVKE